MNELYAKALSLVAQKFENIFDKSGEPYFLHCLHVMNHLPEDDIELRVIGLMHDLLEDTDVTPKDLYDMGFSDRIVTALMLLTHGYESYDDYIKRLSGNEDARQVKLADLRHNSDITRLKGLRKKDFDRMEKYHRAYNYLKY